MPLPGFWLPDAVLPPCPLHNPVLIPRPGSAEPETRYNTLPPAATGAGPVPPQLGRGDEERIWAPVQSGAVFLREASWGAQTPPGEQWWIFPWASSPATTGAY